MATGDGICRSVIAVSAQERKRFIDAVIELNKLIFLGAGSDVWAAGVRLRWLPRSGRGVWGVADFCESFQSG
jgi:hypothetical protein